MRLQAMHYDGRELDNQNVPQPGRIRYRTIEDYYKLHRLECYMQVIRTVTVVT